jgi:hypothetical protein
LLNGNTAVIADGASPRGASPAARDVVPPIRVDVLATGLAPETAAKRRSMP